MFEILVYICAIVLAIKLPLLPYNNEDNIVGAHQISKRTRLNLRQNAKCKNSSRGYHVQLHSSRLRLLQMPSEYLLEDAFPITLNYISMTRHNLVKIPPIDLLNTGIEARPISAASSIPDKSPLAHRCALRLVQRREQLGQNSGLGIKASFAELLSGWQIEH
jgi:hypothetical protein